MQAVARRLALSVAALVIGSLLIFSAAEALPGDAAEAALGRSATPTTLAAKRKELGLDRPFVVRYGDWVGGAVHGDLGESLSASRPVWGLIQPRLRNSLLLAAFAVLFTVPISVLLGLVSGLRRGGWLDGSVSGVALFMLSLPEFVLGILLATVFGVLL